MKANLQLTKSSSTFNECVLKAYTQILKQAKALLATIEEEPLRYTLIRQEKPIPGAIIHELVNPLLYLRLECHQDNEYSIHYGFELSPVFGPYYKLTSSFVRTLYKLTMANESSTNIEESLRTDWIITNCSELYEHVEEHNRNHRFELIKHKAKPTKRKLSKVA
jgi:hypothetical protein